MNKKKINIGLDIGVASVGWSIIDDEYNILNLGVRTFDDVANPKDGKLSNQKRRESRHIRRTLRRTKLRKEEFLKLLVNEKWTSSIEESRKLIDKIDITKFNIENPIELKVKALKQKISKQELILILFHYIHHRGYFYLTEEDLENNSNENKSNYEYPSEEIFNFYKENGYYKDSPITKNISAIKYENEIRKILSTQEINSDFIEKYLFIYNSVRDFATGPGGAKSPTKYGMYYKDQNGNITKREGENLWEITIGKCTYYKDEKRGGKNSPIAEIFNLINDVNNIRFFKNSKYKLNKNIKEIIYKKYSDYLNKDRSFNLKPKELINLGTKINWFEENLGKTPAIDNIDGYRVDEKNEKIITSLKNYNLIAKWLIKHKFLKENINILDIDSLKKINYVFEILSKHNDVLKRQDVLKQYCFDNKINVEIDDIWQLVKSLKGISKMHSLSYKAMLEFIEYSSKNIGENLNQMQYFTKHSNIDDNLPKSKYISKDSFKDEIISPTAKRAITQTVNVVNKIIKHYLKDYEINNVTIEMPRDKNTAEERRTIEKINKNNRNNLLKISENFFNGIDIDKLNNQQKIRMKLWDEQNRLDIYDGNEISENDILTGSGLDIDHIIPFSISGDDSINNKVLTHKYNNSEKSNDTPWQWLTRIGKYESFKKRVESNEKISKVKKTNLFYENDPMEDIGGFIGKNLSDTRYASRVVLNLMQNHFNNNEFFHDVKVKVIRGSLTNFARYNLFVKSNGKSLIPKDRDVYCHHAIDASIVCWLGMNKTIQNLLNYSQYQIKNLDNKYEIKDNKIIDLTTGEVVKDTVDINKAYEKNESVINFGKLLEKYNSTYDKENNELIKGEFSDKVKFSRMYSTKNNLPLSNETIYSFKLNDNKQDGFIIKKLDLIEEPIKKLNLYFKEDAIENKKIENLLCFQNDKHLYEKLKIIYNQYYDSKNNPFINYMNEKYKENNIDKKPLWIEINNNKIKKLKYISDPKKMENIILLSKNSDINSNKIGILESLNCIELRIYKDINNKYNVIPINQKVLKYHNEKLMIDQEKFNKLLSNENIVNKKYVSINSGTIFIKKNTNDLYYSNGGGIASNNRLEIKCLYAKDTKRNIITVQSIVKNYDIAEVDELGNIYNRKSIDELL